MFGQRDWIVASNRTVGPNDSHGRPTYTLSSFEVKGRVQMLSAQEVGILGRFAELMDGIVAVPKGTPVSDKDVVTVGQYRLDGVTPTRIAQELWGTWEIKAIMATPALLRLHVRRNT